MGALLWCVLGFGGLIDDGMEVWEFEIWRRELLKFDDGIDETIFLFLWIYRIMLHSDHDDRSLSIKRGLLFYFYH